jgi:hypothetical protein
LVFRSLLAQLKAHLAHGGTFRSAEAELATPRSTLSRVAVQHKLPRRRRGLSPEKQRKVERLVARGVGGRKIQEKAKVSRSTAWRYQQLAVLDGFRDLIKRSNTPLPCKPWRCPVGGELVKLTICVAHGTRKPPRVQRRGGTNETSPTGA